MLTLVAFRPDLYLHCHLPRFLVLDHDAAFHPLLSSSRPPNYPALRIPTFLTFFLLNSPRPTVFVSIKLNQPLYSRSHRLRFPSNFGFYYSYNTNNMSFILRPARIVQFLILVYVTIAFLYSTNHLVISPLMSSVWTRPLFHASSKPWLIFLSGPLPLSTVHNRDFAKANPNSLKLPNSPNDVIQWVPSDFATMEIQDTNLTPVMMAEDLLLSKAFSQSMGPSKIIPFFYRASGQFDKEDITITTLVTSNRFNVFVQLVENYQGEFHNVEPCCNSYAFIS